MAAKRRPWARWMWCVLVCLFVAYVASYLVLSRRGFAECERTNGVAFYFFPPENTAHWRRWNYGCVAFYYPLLVIDNWLGTGMPFAGEPTWKLS